MLLKAFWDIMSDLCPGSTFNRKIIKRKILEQLQSGDEIMADMGSLIYDLPPFLM